jgi:hypothetical protein
LLSPTYFTASLIVKYSFELVEVLSFIFSGLVYIILLNLLKFEY